MSKHERVTFSRGREVIEHAVRYLTGIRDALNELQSRDHGERVKMLLRSVEAEHRNLLGSVERLLEDGSEKVLETYVQYTVEMPMEVELPEEPLTTLGLVQWLESYNRPLFEMLQELSEKRDSEEMTEAFEALATQVEAHERRLSKEFQSTEYL